MNFNITISRNHFNFFLSFILILIILIRSSVIRYVLPNTFFYIYIIVINLYLFSSERVSINKSSIYLYVLCLISLIFSFIFGWINPLLNSWHRLFLFILTFNIIGPFLNNSSSVLFRSVLYKALLFSLPLIFLIDSFYILYFRRITFGGQAEGFLQSSNLSGVIAALNILMFLIYFLRNDKRINKIFYLFIILLGIPILLASASRAAILALLVCILFLFFLNVKKISLLLILFFFISLLLFDYIEPFYQILIAKIDTRSNSGDITAGRSKMVIDNISDFKKNPVSGVGFYNMYNSTNSKINSDGSLEYSSGWLFVLSSMGLFGIFYFMFILKYYFLHFFNISSLKSKIGIFSFITFFIVHSNFEGYIYSAGGLLFYLFWLNISIFNDKYISENITNFSGR